MFISIGVRTNATNADMVLHDCRVQLLSCRVCVSLAPVPPFVRELSIAFWVRFFGTAYLLQLAGAHDDRQRRLPLRERGNHHRLYIGLQLHS